jgi:hypothetical protein
MKKIALATVLLMFMSTIFADANVENRDKNNSFLMTAPGTITGRVNNLNPVPQPQRQAEPPPAPANSYIQPPPPQFVQDDYNFPQYGQLRAHPNPWLDQPARRARNRAPSGYEQRFDNPWDISNLPSLAPNGYQNKPLPGAAMRDPAYGFYGDDYGSSSFYPPFSTPLDQNMGRPPSAAGFPNMNGLMPGLGKDDGSFPFMPFGMF